MKDSDFDVILHSEEATAIGVEIQALCQSYYECRALTTIEEAFFRKSKRKITESILEKKKKVEIH
jgi:hypothetical protein